MAELDGSLHLMHIGSWGSSAMLASRDSGGIALLSGKAQRFSVRAVA